MDETSQLPRELMSELRGYQSTVWFIPHPKASVESIWLSSKIYPSLEEALEDVTDDLEHRRHFGFEVIVHTDKGDRFVSPRELTGLLAIHMGA